MPGGIRMTLEGDGALIQRLLRAGERAKRMALEATEDSVDMVKNRAIEGIANGPKTGRIYDTYFWTRGRGADRVLMRGKPRPPHQASARGEYPAADTGNLMRSIWGEIEGALVGVPSMSADLTMGDQIIHGVVGADAAYAIPLEYKDPMDGGRPFMRKAMAESEGPIRERYMEMRGRIFD